MKLQDSQPSPLEDWSEHLGRPDQQVLVKRDDLLPFPLAGNKVRKLISEFAERPPAGRVVITVGAITSNHCRTVAYMAARNRADVHLVLHGDPDLPSSRVALAQFAALRAAISIVVPDEIRTTVERLERRYGNRSLVVEGGCHTPAAVRAYVDAAQELRAQIKFEPDVLLVATGTGATHAGLAVGCHQLGWKTLVLGVSIAREASRAENAVREAAGWCIPEAANLRINLTDDYRAGGYGVSDNDVDAAVARSIASGLPVDPTYMGKVMSAFYDLNSKHTAESVVIWHTGGYGNLLFSLLDRQGLPSDHA